MFSRKCQAMGSVACLLFAACALSRRRVIQCGGPCSTDCSLGRGFCKRSQVFVSAWPLRVIDLGRRVEQYERFSTTEQIDFDFFYPWLIIL